MRRKRAASFFALSSAPIQNRKIHSRTYAYEKSQSRLWTHLKNGYTNRFPGSQSSTQTTRHTAMCMCWRLLRGDFRCRILSPSDKRQQRPVSRSEGRQTKYSRPKSRNGRRHNGNLSTSHTTIPPVSQHGCPRDTSSLCNGHPPASSPFCEHF